MPNLVTVVGRNTHILPHMLKHYEDKVDKSYVVVYRQSDDDKILEEIDTLFKKGFKKVLYIQAAPVDFDSFVSLMVNLSDSFKDDQKVGAVQGYSRGVSTDAASVSVEQNEWDGFIINQKQWSIVKGKVLKAKTRNFTRSLSVVFDEKKLVRLSLDMSRNKQYTKSDARRKKFNV